MKKVMLTILLTLVCCQAGIGAERFQVTLQSGMGFKELNSSLALGAAPSYQLFRHFFLEVELFYYPRTESWHTEWQKGHEDFFTGSFSFLFELGKSSRWTPFFFVGASLMREYFTNWDYVPGWIDRHTRFSDDLFNFAAGTGFKVWLKPRFGLRFETCVYIRPSVEEYSDILNRWRISGGVIWKLLN